MRTILIFLFISLFANANASDFHKKHRERKPPLWDTLYFKNEISLDVSLPLAFLLSTEPGDGALAASYLRALTKKDFLRVSTKHRFESFYENRYNLDNYNSSFHTFGFLQDSVIIKTSRNYHYYSPDLRFGYEHRFGKRRVKAILGVDAFIGVEMENTDNWHTYYVQGQLTDTSGNTQSVFYEVERWPRSTIGRVVNLKVGVAPFGGMFAHLSKRFSVRATMMYDLFWSHNLSFSSTSSDFFRPSDSFKITLDGLLAEVGVNVHF